MQRMSGDVVILLDELKKALFEFVDKIDVNKDSDIRYGDYLKDLLFHTANNYDKLKNDIQDISEVSYRTLFVILPGNVPMVFFEVLPLSIIFNIKTFFKYPEVEKRLYDKFLMFLSINYPKIKEYYHGFYLPHNEVEKKIKDFDFVFFFGSEKLIPLIKKVKKPFRFFGPGFSIGIAFCEITKDFIKDVLYFDQKGCLSMKFLFYTNDDIKHRVIDIFKLLSPTIPPTSLFSEDKFTYTLLFLSSSTDILFKNQNAAILETKDEIFTDMPLPDRTLILKKIKKEEDVLRFLNQKIKYLQSIATDAPEKLNILRRIPSFITHFGGLQYQPYNFLFKKGVNLKNIFEEDKNDY